MCKFGKKIFIILFLFQLIISFSSIGLKAEAKKSAQKIIQYVAKDGFNITGELEIPKGSSLKKKSPLVIFVHPLGKDRKDWGNFPLKVYQSGFAILNLDLRGHGQSLLNKNSKPKYWQNFKEKDFSKYPDDLIGIIDYLKEEYPEINTSRIGIVASDIGANASIIASSHMNKNVKTLVLLSPTTKYKGLETRIPIVGYGNNPVLIMVSKKDTFVYKESSELIKYAQGKKQLKVYPFGGSGTNLIKFQPDAGILIIKWLKDNI